MNLLYNLIVLITRFSLKLIAPFNEKIKQGVKGRSETFSILEQSISNTDKTFWFHCASLGEYEQGLPVFNELRNDYPNHKIILSFFSPSGFEIKKNNSIADVVVYLPLDTKKNAKHFLKLVHPELILFIKYDIWPNFLNTIKEQKHRALLISALFRKEQSFFKFYGKPMRKALFAFEHIFTQNEDSKIILEQIGYKSASVTGDTRFDRVLNQLKQNNTLDFIDQFKNNKFCVVAGSTWPEGENFIVNYINKTTKNIKFIIAPHNIKSNQINLLKKRINKKTLLFSEKNNKNLSEYQVFIIDAIGILSKIYNYADIAYVGGALGKTGLHNTLEPAVFGIPIIIGNDYKKFPEAKDMILQKSMFSVSNSHDFNTTLNALISDENKRKYAGDMNLKYITKQKGAIIQIANYIRK